MRFKRNAILFWEGQFIISVCLIINAILLFVFKQDIAVLLTSFILLLLAFVLHLALTQDHIIMNEDGITCHKGKKQCWAYQWNEIKEFKYGNRLRNPSVDVILKGNSSKNSNSDLYFQLGYSAKKAIKVYCKCPITKTS